MASTDKLIEWALKQYPRMTAEKIVASLSREGLPAGLEPKELQQEVRAFRKLSTSLRLRRVRLLIIGNKIWQFAKSRRVTLDLPTDAADRLHALSLADNQDSSAIIGHLLMGTMFVVNGVGVVPELYDPSTNELVQASRAKQNGKK